MSQEKAGRTVEQHRTQAPPQGINFLLVIAIDAYVHCPRLYNCVKDAHDLIELLTERYHFERNHFKEIFNAAATRANIYNAFREMAQRVTPNDNLLIYFSGHGEYDPVLKRGFWIPVEAQPSDHSQYISNSDIKDFLSAINSHHTFLMVDSCFSGALFAEKDVSSIITKRYEKDPSRWCLTAGRNEIVSDGKPGDNSPFAKSLLYRLRQNTDALGVMVLCAHVIEQVHDETTNQTPIGEPLKVEGHKNGQFVFHLKKDEARDWAAAQQENTVIAYEHFLQNYPTGTHADEACGLMVALQDEAAWQEADREKTIAAYERYLHVYPDGRYAHLAIEAQAALKIEEAWQHATRQNTIPAYREFEKSYPNSKYRNEAEIKTQQIENEQREEEIQTQGKKEEPSIYYSPPPPVPLSPNIPSQVENSKKKKRYIVYALLAVAVFAFGIIGVRYLIVPPKSDSTYYITDSQNNRYPYKKMGDGNDWLLENLKYNIEGSVCYENDSINCDSFGRLYTWDAAKKACAGLGDGWRLPTNDEWEALIKQYKNRSEAYKKLISGGSSGFNALFGGWQDHSNEFDAFGKKGFYWTSTDIDIDKAYLWGFENDSLELYKSQTESKYSCRCVKSEEYNPPIDTNSANIVKDENNNPYRYKKMADGRYWLMENLKMDIKKEWSTCYSNDSSYCNRFGRLYSQKAAKKACASLSVDPRTGFGWRLPTKGEWDELVQNSNGTKELFPGGAFSFFLQMGGVFSADILSGKVKDSFKSVDLAGFYWTSSKDTIIRLLTINSSENYFNIDYPYTFLSCRCIQDTIPKKSKQLESENFSYKGYAYKVMDDGKYWLTENLRINTGESSSLYPEFESLGELYGRLYTWIGAKEACKKLGNGWRLPTEKDWEKLLIAEKNGVSNGGYLNTTGLVNTPYGASETRGYLHHIENGHSGFNAQLGGQSTSDGKFYGLFKLGAYWSSTLAYENQPFIYTFIYESESAFLKKRIEKQIAKNQFWKFSCRCVNDRKPR